MNFKMKLLKKDCLSIFLVQFLIKSSFGIFLPRSGNPYENILQLGLHNYLEQARPVEVPINNAAFDFIIVGAGPAGCVLANRLSENPNWTVYLLEAGGTENIAHLMPVMAAFLQGTHSNWNYKSVPQKRSCLGMRNNECFLPRGKVLGGSSSINYMIYNRGNKRDYDRWAKAGNVGWSYNEVLPYFLRSERANLQGLENSPYHNRSGLLSVEDVDFRSAMVHAFVKGTQEAGHKYTDYNGETQLGVSYVQATTLNGKRHSAAKSYIDPIRYRRKNLHVITLARVTKILIDPKTKSAYGVDFVHRGKKYTIRARKEVIISSGSFNSPQLLMLSGIGPKDNLKAIGIPQIQNLPVGQRLYDHMCHFGPTFTTNATGATLFANRISVNDVAEWISGNSRTRISTIGGVESLAFIKTPNSREPADFPDIEIIMVSGSLASDGGTGLKEGANFRDDLYNKVYKPLENREHFSFLIMHFHPKSVGRVWLEDRNPFNWPKIDPKYFKEEEDIEFLLEGIKEAIRISKTPAMQKIGTELYTKNVVGCEDLEFGTDDYWRCSIRVMSYTLHHQVATCKMGPASDPTTVVNPQLKVHGIRRLRVVDTSIIPFPPTAHTNAASFMIGEKAADMIREEWTK
ncbi:glucose dehydrogenase [FAD, quinone] [Episyrphus balteatus]|uniref:glucose dehydrogenase [FAD, quinone] n=1 Tax=Episyrphus balteatus TaxID=286459 RepID=UPI0024862D35|nr:glucose dehydrogenase [FAD, quinone] [Episyrphus balteatus]